MYTFINLKRDKSISELEEKKTCRIIGFRTVSDSLTVFVYRALQFQQNPSVSLYIKVLNKEVVVK